MLKTLVATQATQTTQHIAFGVRAYSAELKE